MNLPITNYEITLRDIVDIIICIIIIFGIIGSVIFTNIIINLFINLFVSNTNTKNIKDIKINLFILFINIVIVLFFIMLIIYVSKELIKNTLILNSLFTFIGPTIVSSLLYFTPIIKTLIKLTI